jgi:uncharacterized Tic20 family protein
MQHSQNSELLFQNRIEKLEWSQDWVIILVFFPVFLILGISSFHYILEKFTLNDNAFKEYIMNHSLYRVVIALSISLWFIFVALLLFFNFLCGRIKIWQYKIEYNRNPDLWYRGVELNYKLEKTPKDFVQAILTPLGYAIIFLAIPSTLLISYEKNYFYFCLAIPLLIIFFFKLRNCIYAWLIPFPNLEIDYHPLPKNVKTRLRIFSTADNNILKEVNMSAVLVCCESIRKNIYLEKPKSVYISSRYASIEYKEIYKEYIFENINVNSDSLPQFISEFSIPSNLPTTQKEIFDTKLKEEKNIEWKIIIEQTYNHYIYRILEYNLLVI